MPAAHITPIGESIGASATSGAKRRVNACVHCHHKKIRCDLDPTAYRPCSSCASLEIPCQRRTRKQYSSRKDKDTPAASRKASPTATAPTAAAEDAENSINACAENFIAGSSVSGGNAAATEPFFSGDSHGYGYVLEICNAGNESSTQHHFIPSAASSAMDKADLAYAEAKGCFAVLNPAVCEDFIYAYFHYVHPMLPVIDIGDFLDRYWGRSTEPLSMLLLWSMFSVAASFVPEHTVKTLNCKDRHELKRLLYSRAKCLYSLEYEKDSVILIQSCLLVGYWYSNLQDRTQSWYWTGIAISTAQTIGLHRDPDAKRHNSLLSPKDRRLWKNLWWCCVLRDRWLAYGTGRPLRIKSSDHDMPFPDGECMLLPRNPSLYPGTPIPSDLSHLNSLFLGLLRLAVVLGDILESIYRMPQPRPPQNDLVSALAQRLQSCSLEITPDASGTQLTEFFTLYGAIHVEVVTIALYRPFTTEVARPKMQHDALLRSVADTSVRKAASQVNALLDLMISADTLKFAGPTMVSLLIPAMTIHLNEILSKNQSDKAWSHNRLDFCLLVLKQLERNYPAATLVHELFVHARDKSCVPFGISQSQAGANQSASIVDKEGGGRDSDENNGGYDFPGSDPFSMRDIMPLTPSSHQLSTFNDLDEETLASYLADNGASSLFPMDMDSLFNIG